MDKLTENQVLLAIQDSDGTILSISVNLGREWHTTRDYINNNEVLVKALADRIMKVQEVNKEMVLQCIMGSCGIVSRVAEKLRVSWITAKMHIHKWDETLEAFTAERENMVDKAENTIDQLIDSADPKIRLDAAKYVVSRQGKSRGWTEKHEVEDVTARPLNIKIDWGNEEETGTE